ncbi:MAG: DUF4097 family beta strand repeat-containing protein [Acidobacteriota bacterium]|nr:DUF4097 family beta strand repeat-containing protein [Acidobacteriota bacterium]
MPNRFFSRLIVALACVAGASPASAAVTLRGLLLDEGPRPSWFERYQDSRQGPETVDKTSQTFKVGDAAALDLTGIAGDVRVTGGSGNEIRVEATRRVRHRSADEAKRLLNELRVEMNNFNGRVEVRSVYPRRSSSGDRGFSGRIDYVIAVPTGASVAVKSISGDVIVSGVRGEVRAETISGDVSIDSSPNLALAKTVSGDVTARDAGGATTMVLSTVSGSVIASGLKVRTLQAGSVSGNVRLSGTQVERVEAKSVSGNIDFDAPLIKAGRYAFTSHSGNVRIVLSGDTGFELDADTFSGSVRSDVPVTLRTTGRNDRDQRRGSSNRAIRGAYGDASALVSVRSHSGSVVITKK